MTTTAPRSTPANAAHEREAIHRIIERLHSRFSDRPTEEVEQAVSRAYATFHGCRIRDSITILVERLAGEDLHAAEPITADRPGTARAGREADPGRPTRKQGAR